MTAKHGYLRHSWFAVCALAVLAATIWCGAAVAGDRTEKGVEVVSKAPAAEQAAEWKPDVPQPEHKAAVSEEEKRPDKAESGKAKGTEAQAKPFNMDELIERLKKSDAIGFLTKLTLRSDALDLVGMVKAYKEHESRYSLADLHARFNGLLLKVLALLSDDPKLSRDISVAREDIWKSLLEVKA